MTINDYTSKKLRELRLKHGYTQVDVANALKYNGYTAYTSLENGSTKAIAIDKVFLACKLFKISISDFYADFNEN